MVVHTDMLHANAVCKQVIQQHTSQGPVSVACATREAPQQPGVRALSSTRQGTGPPARPPPRGHLLCRCTSSSYLPVQYTSFFQTGASLVPSATLR